MTPTQRSLKYLRDRGWTCHIVEKWVPQAKRRIDAFGFGDILAYSTDFQGATLIQTTSGPNLAARVTKILENPMATGWIRAGNRIIVHGWRKTKPRGQTVARWGVIEREINGSPQA